jgi:phosphoglycerate dehydrogenase-like enzyme
MPERQRVLLINPMLHPVGEDRLAQEVELIRLNNPAEGGVVETMKGVHGVVANAGGHVTGRAIMTADRLAVIAVAGAGYDRVGLEAATKRGIPVVNNTGLGPIPSEEAGPGSG